MYCPIGYARLKLDVEFIHYTILNLPFSMRQSTENVQLCCMTLGATLKKYKPCDIISGQLSDENWQNDSSPGAQLRAGFKGA